MPPARSALLIDHVFAWFDPNLTVPLLFAFSPFHWNEFHHVIMTHASCHSESITIRRSFCSSTGPIILDQPL
jgi:hypothetical protein